MPVKYYCPKCAKRYVEWGAEKLKFKCPECEEEKLLRIGTDGASTVGKRPSLRRNSKKKQDEVALLKTELDLEKPAPVDDLLLE